MILSAMEACEHSAGTDVGSDLGTRNGEAPRRSADSESTSGVDLSTVAESVREFVRARDWEQFHSLKNLTMALSGEVGELAAILQWCNDDEVRELLASEAGRSRVEEEVADIAIYLLRIVQQADIDLAVAIERKIAINGRKYPVLGSKGTAKKYSELDRE